MGIKEKVSTRRKIRRKTGVYYSSSSSARLINLPIDVCFCTDHRVPPYLGQRDDSLYVGVADVQMGDLLRLSGRGLQASWVLYVPVQGLGGHQVDHVVHFKLQLHHLIGRSLQAVKMGKKYPEYSNIKIQQPRPDIRGPSVLKFSLSGTRSLIVKLLTSAL